MYCTPQSRNPNISLIRPLWKCEPIFIFHGNQTTSDSSSNSSRIIESFSCHSPLFPSYPPSFPPPPSAYSFLCLSFSPPSVYASSAFLPQPPAIVFPLLLSFSFSLTLPFPSCSPPRQYFLSLTLLIPSFCHSSFHKLSVLSFSFSLALSFPFCHSPFL